MPRRRVARRRTSRKRPRSFRRQSMRPVVREEMKTVDTLTGTIEFSVDGAVATNMVLLNTIPQGSTAITRIGKRVIMKALQIRGYLIPGATTVQDKCSILLVYVRSNNLAATLPPWDTILDTQHSNSLTCRDNATKFKILRRWDYAMGGNNTVAQQVTPLITFDEYIVFKKPLVAQWKTVAAEGTIAQFEKGSLLLCTVGAVGVTANTTKCIGTFRTRLYFTESDGYMF